MASSERVRKVTEQIRREFVSILPDAIFHDKIAFVSVTGINLSRDFKYATVYISIIGDDLVLREELMKLLNKNSRGIRHLLAQRLTTRTVPEMTFQYDNSIEYGARMEKLIHDIVEKDENRSAEENPDHLSDYNKDNS